MKKYEKMLCMLLAAVFLLCCLPGCGDKQPDSTGNGTTDTTGTTGATIGETNGPGEVILPTTPENPGNDLIDYDPEREIYFFSGGNDFTIYEGYTTLPGYSLYIMSQNELDVSSIQLSVPVQSNYATSVKQLELMGTDDSGSLYHGFETVFPYELYQCYLGKDFARLLALKKEYQQFQNAYESGECTWEEVNAAQKAYNDYQSAELDAYEQLTMADLPQFYLYMVSASFLDAFVADEAFSRVELAIGDQSYQLDIGEVRLRKNMSLPAELDWSRGDYNATHGIFGSAWGPSVYNDGLHYVDCYFSFTATEPMLLTELVLDNPNQRLEKVWVRIRTADGLQSHRQWDMSEPVEIYPGDIVRISIAYHHDNLSVLASRTKLWGFLIYECADGTVCKISECDIHNGGINFYEMYAIIFDGLDMESYYRDYYYPTYEPWRQEIAN